MSRNANLGHSERNTIYLSHALHKVALKVGPNKKVKRKSERCATEPQRGAKRRFTVDEVLKIRSMTIKEARVAFGLSENGARAIISGENYSWVL